MAIRIRDIPYPAVIGLVLILLVSPAGLAGATSGSPPIDRQSQDLMDVKRRIETHYFSYNVSSLRQLLKTAGRLQTRRPQSWYPLYYAGMIHVLIGNTVRAEDKQAAHDSYRAAVDVFEKALRQNAIPELQILTSMAYGKLASLETVKMIYYGCKAKSHMQRAFKGKPQDPKLYLVAAVHLMFTPEMFGGSKVKSRALLEDALAMNQRPRQTDPLRVDWASDTEIYAYLAQLEILQENKAAAMGYAQEALRRKPHYGFVHRDLMPHIHGEPINTTYHPTKPYCEVGVQ